MCLFYHIEKYYSHQDGVHESAQSRNSKFRVDISQITSTITNHFCLSWRINLSFYRSKWSKTHNTCQYYGRFLVLVECDLDFFLTLMNRYILELIQPWPASVFATNFCLVFIWSEQKIRLYRVSLGFEFCVIFSEFWVFFQDKGC